MRWIVVVALVAVTAGMAAAEPVVTRPRITGTYAPVTVQRYLRRDANAYQYCHQREPGVSGKLGITFRIQPDGGVTAVRVEGVSNGIENCVAQRLRRMRLPRAIDGTASEVAMTMTLPKPRPAPPPATSPAWEAILTPCTCPCTCDPGKGIGLGGA